jgi:hypothetical protein
MNNREDHRMKRACELANRLRSTLFEHQGSELSLPEEPIGEGVWRPLPKIVPSEVTSLQPFGDIIESLDQTLIEAGYGNEQTEHRLAPDEFWTLGSRTISFPIRGIHIGFIEPVLRVPIISRLSETVVAFLLTIEGERDLLKREHHSQVGWHYHYLDFKKARSNIVLCWDTRAVRQNRQDHPLFQETHGEGHADFPGRPDLWGNTKKKSMHDACAPDLDNWPLSTFRCASNKAGPVWPLAATLTPLVNAPPPGFNANAKRVCERSIANDAPLLFVMIKRENAHHRASLMGRRRTRPIAVVRAAS